MTRRMSQRARAQEIYREMAEASAASPLPNPPPQAGEGKASAGERERAECAASAEPDLTARVRALYENSAVPVREIARLAGVTERTLYKYAQKGGWKARYAWVDRGGVARRARAADAVAPKQFAPTNVMPVRGAGGRFVARADKDKPFAEGLQATDPAGAARATSACVQADGGRAGAGGRRVAAMERQLQPVAADRHRHLRSTRGLRGGGPATAACAADAADGDARARPHESRAPRSRLPRGLPDGVGGLRPARKLANKRHRLALPVERVATVLGERPQRIPRLVRC
jgi:hypothetical protein